MCCVVYTTGIFGRRRLLSRRSRQTGRRRRVPTPRRYLEHVSIKNFFFLFLFFFFRLCFSWLVGIQRSRSSVVCLFIYLWGKELERAVVSHSTIWRVVTIKEADRMARTSISTTRERAYYMWMFVMHGCLVEMLTPLSNPKGQGKKRIRIWRGWTCRPVDETRCLLGRVRVNGSERERRVNFLLLDDGE